MKRTRIWLAVWMVASVAPLASADEGMWMLHQLRDLDQAKLRQMGLQLTPEQLWDPATRTGLASATPSLGGCSSSFVSPDGLVVTNHHCAFGALQINSSPEHDYITNGFLAKTMAEELPSRSSRIFVFKGYEDVTEAMRGALKPTMTPIERARASERKEKELIAACEQDGLTCRVANMFSGLRFYLFRQLELRDVRLVYAPARAIGEYGGEVDNWMWPRHTGDFSFLRGYVGKDGKPADYSPDNVPFRPDRFLKIATEPIKEGDFTMIMGYPGRTYRYRLASEIANDTGFYYPQRIKLTRDWIAILEERGATSKDVEIKLASTLKGLFNTAKNNEGMLLGLKTSDLAGRKRAEEAKLAAWIAADPTRQAKFGDAIVGLEKALAANRAMREREMVMSFLPRAGGGRDSRSSSLLSSALTLVRWAQEKTRPDLEREQGFHGRDERSIRQRLTIMQQNLDIATEKATLAYFLRQAQALPASQRIGSLDKALAATGKEGDEAIDALLNRLFTGTRLTDPAVRLGALDLDAAALAARKDPMLDLAVDFLQDIKAGEDAKRQLDGEMLVAGARYMEALTAFRGTALYPDANGTLRFTYATIQGYNPRDGVSYKPFTTLRGVLDKNTGEEPFACPPDLVLAAEKAEPGRYLDPKLGTVPVNFLSTNDITGGNSGSPIMNGRGELIGLAFDGNYESMTSDYQFEIDMSRTINVDARYMLWIMENVDGAQNLLKEMGLAAAGN